MSAYAVTFVFTLTALAQSGGYRPVADTNDAGVDMAAKFAVSEQSTRSKTTVTLNSVVKASDKEPILGARDFMLCLDTSIQAKQTYVQAIVTMDQYSNLKLMGWSKSTCGNGSAASVPGFKPDTAYKAVDLDDPGADFAAQNAIRLQSAKTKSKITFGEMVKVEDKEPTLGTRDFRLCMSVINNGKPGRALALVSMDQYSNYKLTDWKDGRCGESADGFTTVKNSDPGIGLAADFAIKKHSEDKGVAHSLVSILKAENKGMFEMTYRICMKIDEEGEKHIIQAVVSMDQYSNMKLVSWEHSTCGN